MARGNGVDRVRHRSSQLVGGSNVSTHSLGAAGLQHNGFLIAAHQHTGMALRS